MPKLYLIVLQGLVVPKFCLKCCRSSCAQFMFEMLSGSSSAQFLVEYMLGCSCDRCLVLIVPGSGDIVSASSCA